MKSITGKKEWNKILDENFNTKDLYFKYEYFDLYKRHYGASPECIFWENKYLKVFWPHLIRDVSKLTEFEDFKFYDLTTPYGYGGPIINLKTADKIKIKQSIISFFENYKNYALKNNYICEFIRFHPVFKNVKLFNEIFNVEYLNDVIILDLSLDLEKICKGIRKGHKYSIKKSIREGCYIKFIKAPSKEDINNFIEFYHSTMDRNYASKKYYFSADFINDHFNLLNTILVQAKYKNKVIGASMFIYGDDIIHYHLSGTLNNSRNLYPSHLILFELIKWSKENNFKYLHLGGGRGKNDSLFEFKRGFSKLTFPFHIAKLIFDNKIYEKLTKLNKKVDSTDYFPKYRYGLDKKII